MKSGLSFINLRRKLEKQVKEVTESIAYLDELEEHLQSKTNPDLNSKLKVQQECLNEFLSDSIPRAILKSQGAMLYWIEATGKSREELERLKNDVC